MINNLIELIEYIENLNPYYTVLALSIFGLMLLASLKHKTIIPFLYGIVVSGIMLCYNQYLENQFMGFWNYGYTVIGVLSLVYLILWTIVNIQIIYNAIDTGELTQ